MTTPLNDRIAKHLITYKASVICMVLTVVLVAALGISKLQFNDDYRAYFSENDPYKMAHHSLEQEYSESEYLLLVVTAKDGSIFSHPVLSAIEDITKQAWSLPYVLRVDSITNYQFSRADGDDLLIDNLYDSEYDLTTGQLMALKEYAISEPEVVNKILSPNARVTSIVLTSQTQTDRSKEHFALATATRVLKKQVEEKYPFLDIRLSGNIMMPVAMREASLWDATILIPSMVLIIFLIIYLFTKSMAATIGVMLVTLLASVSTLGISGWFNIQLSAISTAAISIILILAVADCIHLFTTFSQRLNSGYEKREALIASISSNMLPIFLTSLTTVIGMLTFNFNESPQLQNLGNITAIGVVSAWLLSIFFMPAYLANFRFKAQRTRPLAGSGLIVRLADFIIKKYRLLLIWGGIACAVLISLTSLNRADDQFIRYFGEQMEFRKDAYYTIENLTGLNLLNYSIPATKPNGILSIKYLHQLEHLTDWLRLQPEVVHVDSITDTFKRINKNLHEDDPAWYHLPETSELAAQYMLLYELSLPFGLGVNDRINMDKSSTKLVVTLTDLSSSELLIVEKRISRWINHNVPELQTTPTGPAIMFSHISERTIKSMVVGTLLGFLLIAVVLGVALRSAKFGLISLLPNLIPAGLAFGIWGLTVGQVSMAVSVVLAMTLGIVVDDTVHFLSKYLSFRHKYALSASEAIKQTFSSVGVALTITSLALFGGFSALGFSQFVPNALLATITAIAIIMALLVNFLIIPPLLLLIDGNDKNNKN